MPPSPSAVAPELPSTRQLLRSTLIAAVSAAVILVAAVLPAEYGIDPTGAGRALGLTTMGEIKTQLSIEAEADRRMSQQPADPCGDQKSERPAPSVADLFIGRASAAELPRLLLAQAKTDEAAVTLKPGQGAEVKVVMKKGAKVRYAWKVEGGVVNHDTHGERTGSSTAHSYKKANAVAGDEGVLEAAFDGEHGWFWRNRGQADVTVRLRVEGEYQVMKRVM